MLRWTFEGPGDALDLLLVYSSLGRRVPALAPAPVVKRISRVRDSQGRTTDVDGPGRSTSVYCTWETRRMQWQFVFGQKGEFRVAGDPVLHAVE